MVIDRELTEKADIWELANVLAGEVTNCNRWEPYVLPGERGEGRCRCRGAGAKPCQKGDWVIILSFEVGDQPIDPKMILLDGQ